MKDRLQLGGRNGGPFTLSGSFGDQEDGISTEFCARTGVWNQSRSVNSFTELDDKLHLDSLLCDGRNQATAR